MTDTRPIHIMLLAPLPVEKLDAAAEKAYRTDFPFGGGRHPWELRAGTGAYGAMFRREPGTEASEWDLAEAMSRTCKEPVYSLWFDPANPRMIYEWRRGKKLDGREGDPVAFARNLGIDLAPPDVAAPDEPTSVITVAVVDGLRVDDVRALLGAKANEGGLQLAEVRGSTILSAPDGNVRSAPWDLTDALPDRDVYFVHGDRGSGTLSIQQLRGGETIGTFHVPPVDGDEILSEIKGATTVSGILDALGIGPELMPRDGWGG